MFLKLPITLALANTTKFRSYIATYDLENWFRKRYTLFIMKQKILKYDVVFEEQPDEGYTVTVPSLPGCISEGDTFEEAKNNITEAITAYLESLAKDGEDVPEGNSNIFIGHVSVQNPLVQ